VIHDEAGQSFDLEELRRFGTDLIRLRRSGKVGGVVVLLDLAELSLVSAADTAGQKGKHRNGDDREDGHSAGHAPLLDGVLRVDVLRLGLRHLLSSKMFLVRRPGNHDTRLHPLLPKLCNLVAGNGVRTPKLFNLAGEAGLWAGSQPPPAEHSRGLGQ